MAYLTKLVAEDNATLWEAVEQTNVKAQERQAAMMMPGTPETMPGLALPGMGAEAGTAQQPASLESLLSQLG
jgi:hypothetical protein